MSKLVAAFAAVLIGIAVAYLLVRLCGLTLAKCRAAAVRVVGFYVAGFTLLAEMVAAEDDRRNGRGRSRRVATGMQMAW